MINFGYYYYCTIAGHIRCVYRGGEGGNAPSERMGENPRALSRRAAAPPSTADPFAGSDSSADRTVRRAARHGGGVKLLLRCLQSIQCQYYLVFGVVKTVPLCSLSRDCASRSVPALSLCRSLCLSLSLSLSAPRHRFVIFIIVFIHSSSPLAIQRLNNNMANGHRYIYILHLLSLRSSLITYTTRSHARGACVSSSPNSSLLARTLFAFPSALFDMKIRITRESTTRFLLCFSMSLSLSFFLDD